MSSSIKVLLEDSFEDLVEEDCGFCVCHSSDQHLSVSSGYFQKDCINARRKGVFSSNTVIVKGNITVSF